MKKGNLVHVFLHLCKQPRVAVYSSALSEISIQWWSDFYWNLTWGFPSFVHSLTRSKKNIGFLKCWLVNLLIFARKIIFFNAVNQNSDISRDAVALAAFPRGQFISEFINDVSGLSLNLNFGALVAQILSGMIYMRW